MNLPVAGRSRFWLHVVAVSSTSFPLLFVTIIQYIMACLRESCPSAWLLKCLCSEPYPPVDGRKEETSTSSWPRLAVLGACWQDWWPFYFVSSLCLLCLGSMKETGIQTPVGRLFWNISLLSSQTAALPLSRMLSCSCRVSLDLVTVWRSAVESVF